jgi:hypothetical protein
LAADLPVRVLRRVDVHVGIALLDRAHRLFVDLGDAVRARPTRTAQWDDDGARLARLALVDVGANRLAAQVGEGQPPAEAA